MWSLNLHEEVHPRGGAGYIPFMPCPHIPTCPMFPLFRMESLLKVWKVNYCEADFNKCVRYQKNTCGEDIPKNLLPNGRMLGEPLSGGGNNKK